MVITSCNGKVSAFSRATGALAWRYDSAQDSPGSQFHGEPLVSAGLLITGSDSVPTPHLYAFAAGSGTLRWKQAEAVIESDVLLVGGLLVGRAQIGDLLALDPGTGRPAWRLSIGGSRCTWRPQSPVALGDRVFYPAADGTLYAVTASTGEVLWKRALDCPSTSPIVIDDDLYLGLAPSRLMRLSTKDGSTLAELPLEGPAGYRLTVTEDAVIALIGDGNALVGFDRALAGERWRSLAEKGWSSPRPLPLGGLVVAGTEDGRLIAFDPVSGRQSWTARLEGTVRGLGSDGQVIYVGMLSGRVYAFEPPAPLPP